MAAPEDISLEEGLLANQEEDLSGETKDTVETIIVEVPKIADRDRDADAAEDKPL